MLPLLPLLPLPERQQPSGALPAFSLSAFCRPVSWRPLLRALPP
jgi:hypothetical protein